MGRDPGSMQVLEVYRKTLDQDRTAAYGTVPQIQSAIIGLCCYGIIVLFV